jgi:hypothetical protein
MLAIIAVIPLILGIDWVGKLIVEINNPTPTLTPTSIISISNDVKDIGGHPIGINNAPFKVSVSGTVLNADGLNIYLIVDDGNHHYVQPEGGTNVGREFSILCQLGKEDDLDSGGKQYTIYAVITNEIYAPYAWFEGKSFIAKSDNIDIIREALPTPTP